MEQGKLDFVPLIHVGKILSLVDFLLPFLVTLYNTSLVIFSRLLSMVTEPLILKLPDSCLWSSSLRLRKVKYYVWRLLSCIHSSTYTYVQWRSTTKIKTGPVSRKWVENKLFVVDGPNLSQNLRESSQERVGHGPVWPTRSAATGYVIKLYFWARCYQICGVDSPFDWDMRPEC
jgi:hypothetical protein